MKRADRLYAILRHLKDGHLHRASDIAALMQVSERTIYRDMERLAGFGMHITGTRGSGYRLCEDITLPPLRLSAPELEALHLGIAIVEQSSDIDLRNAALGLAQKLDALLSETSVAPQNAWKFESHPFADMGRGLAQLPLLRAALKAKQKLQLTYHAPNDRLKTETVRPLKLDHLGRVWTLTGWSETSQSLAEYRLDLIQSAQALPEMFVDETDKMPH